MSGILAVTRFGGSPRLRAALSRLAAIGGEREQLWSHEDTLIAVSRKVWEQGADFSGPVLVLETGDLVVAADASLYARAGLSRALAAARVTPDGSTPSHLIAAAYRAWGTALVEHLIGDYAFAIWDKSKERLLAARDPFGLRGLYWARVGDGVAIGSSSRALAELLGRGSDLNLATVAVHAAGLAWSLGTETSFSCIDTIPPGHRLSWDKSGTRLERFWHPPFAPDENAKDRPEAAEELQALLRVAVAERIGSGLATVSMSGGWDSTAVFAAGQSALAPADRSRLRPVSISYPKGDPGYEDDLINQVAGYWNADVHWIPSEAIPLLDRLEQRAAMADEPPQNLYELWNRELARGARACGARIAMDGSGGDQLFQVSDVVLADLLVSGRWIQFARMARSRLIFGRRHVLESAVFPLLPESLLRATERTFGRRVARHYIERPVADWVRPEFARQHNLRERDLSVLRSVRGDSWAHSQSMFYATCPFFGHAASFLKNAVLQEGVELRSPLMDRRVVEFALSRPVSDRADHAGTKHLLRQSMQGLIPPPVLAPRSHRTGITIGYSRRRMKEAYPGLVARLFAEPLRLADLGVVDPVALRADAERCCAGEGDEWLRVNLFNTMKVEFWLRGLDRSADFSSTAVETRGALMVGPAA